MADQQHQLLTKRGKEKFTDDGFIYDFDKSSKDGATRFWRCECRRVCKARIHVRNGRIVKRVGEHTHLGNLAKLEILKAKNTLKERALNTQDATAVVVADAVADLSPAGQGQLPDMDSLKRTIQRQRVNNLAAPPNPQSLANLIIPDEYTTYESRPGRNEPFLLYDSGPDTGDDRILIFSTRRNLRLLDQAPDWLMDGTFNIAPPLFSQMYTIHARCLDQMIPLIYALLPDKRRATYDRMFAAINTLHDFGPRTIITDYEQAAIQACHAAYPAASQSGCFFHLTQCIQRKIQSIGLQNQYRNDYETFQNCRMLPALAFVPTADVIDAFETLADEMPDELTPLLDYFEDNYVGRPNRRGVRRTPLFPIPLWNMHQRVLDEEDRTTNAVEAWHRGLPTFLGATHPTIWKFVKGIRRIQKTKDVEIEQLVAGNGARGRRPIYERLDERIMNIVEDYENRGILDYLRGISHNIVPY